MKQERKLIERYDSICQDFGAPPVCEQATILRAAAVDDDGMEREAVISTGGVKYDGLDVVQKGLDFARWKENPQVFWGHGRDPNPETSIATGVRAWHSSLPFNGRDLGLHSRSISRFAEPGTNPRSDLVRNMVTQSIIRATSIRWRAKDEKSIEEIPKEELAKHDVAPVIKQYIGGLRYLASWLVEWSWVPLGMDRDALMVRCRSGDVPQDMLDLFKTLRDSDLPSRTEDGIPIFRFDARNIEKEVEVPLHVDMGAAHQEATRQAAVAPKQAEKKPEEPKREDPEPIPSESESDTGIDDEDRAAISYGIHGNVPLAPRERPWDGAAARRRLARFYSSDGSGSKDKMNWGQYARGFVWRARVGADNFGDYKGPHHDVIDGRLVVVWRGVVAIAQRLQQNALSVPAGDYAGMRTHIGREYGRFDEKPPWQRADGQAYEDLHRRLRECTGTPKEMESLRKAVVDLAVQIYGEEREPEPWEPREYAVGDESMWASCRQVLEDGLGVVLGAEDERGALIDTIIERLSNAEGLKTIYREHDWFSRSLKQIADGMGLQVRIGNTQDVERLLRYIDDTLKGARTEPPKAPAEPDQDDLDEESLRQIEASIGSIQDSVAKATPKRKNLLDEITGDRASSDAS